jgi:hypothetical protein
MMVAWLKSSTGAGLLENSILHFLSSLRLTTLLPIVLFRTVLHLIRFFVPLQLRQKIGRCSVILPNVAVGILRKVFISMQFVFEKRLAQGLFYLALTGLRALSASGCKPNPAKFLEVRRWGDRIFWGSGLDPRTAASLVRGDAGNRLA